MRALLLIIIIFPLIICGQNEVNVAKDTLGKNKTSSQDVYLKTGWYLISKDSLGVKRKVFELSDSFFLETKPLMTVDNIHELEIYQSNYGDYGLGIRFNSDVREKWSNITRIAFLNQDRIGLIIDNELIYVAKVKSWITTGISALNRGDISLEKLKEFKKQIELKMN